MREEGSGFKARSSRAERAIRHARAARNSTAASVGNRAPAARRRSERRRSFLCEQRRRGRIQARDCASSSKSKGRDNAKAFDQQEEGLRKGIVLRRLLDFRPVELLPHSTHNQEQSSKIAVVLGERLQLGDHDGSWRQYRNPDAQDLMLMCGIKQRVRDWNASEPMQHIDQRRLLSRLHKLVLVAICLEEPVFGRALDPQAGGCQAVGSRLDISFSHDKIDIVARLGSAGHPEAIAAAQREGDAVGLQR